MLTLICKSILTVFNELQFSKNTQRGFPTSYKRSHNTQSKYQSSCGRIQEQLTKQIMKTLAVSWKKVSSYESWRSDFFFRYFAQSLLLWQQELLHRPDTALRFIMITIQFITTKRQLFQAFPNITAMNISNQSIMTNITHTQSTNSNMESKTPTRVITSLNGKFVTAML